VQASHNSYVIGGWLSPLMLIVRLRGMRFVPLILMLLASSCSLGSHPEAAAQSAVLGDFSLQEVHGAERKMSLLRADMSEEQIFQTLGLGSYRERWLHGAHAGGTSSALGVHYYLRKDCYLTLVFDCSDLQRHVLTYARLGDTRWPQN
jgi:hypothetical protein